MATKKTTEPEIVRRRSDHPSRTAHSSHPSTSVGCEECAVICDEFAKNGNFDAPTAEAIAARLRARPK